MQGYMESEKINDIVEGTFTKVDLSVVNKHHGLNWKGQLQAVLNFVPGCGGFLAQELQNYLDYRDNEFLRKYTTYIIAENGGYPPTQNGDIRSLFWLFSLMALQN